MEKCIFNLNDEGAGDEVVARHAGSAVAADGSAPVLVTTEHRGVFAGLVPAGADITARTLTLRSVRMAIYFGTTRGVLELAETGPTSASNISAVADLAILHDVTAVFVISAEAWAKWQRS